MTERLLSSWSASLLLSYLLLRSLMSFPYTQRVFPDTSWGRSSQKTQTAFNTRTNDSLFPLFFFNGKVKP